MRSRSDLLAQGLRTLPLGAAGLRRGSGASARNSAPIFMLHRVLPEARDCYDPEMAVSLEAFEAWLAWACETYEVVELERLACAGSSLKLRRPRCAITFDDGWVDTYVHAFPVLQRFDAPATVFLPLQFIGTQRRFWQERLFYQLRGLQERPQGAEAILAVARGFPWCPTLTPADLEFRRLRAVLVRRSSPEAEEFVDKLGGVAPPPLELVGRAFLNWDEVQVMHQAGIVFGSHTLDHTLLRCAAPTAADAAVRRSRMALSEQLGTEIRTFAYPWGALSAFSRRQVETAGYSRAVTTAPGLAGPNADPFLLPRIALSDAQLGWGMKTRRRPARGPAAAAATPRDSGFHAPTLQLHLARARVRAAVRHASHAADCDRERERLRIGFIIDNPQAWADTPQEHLGGSELQLLRLIEALDPEFFEVELYFLRRPAEGLPARARWPCFAATPPSAGRLQTIWGMRRLLRARRPDLVQAMFQDGTFLGVPGAWLARVPAIVCARRNAGYWKRWHHRAALRVINRMTTCWQTNARTIADMLQRDEGISAEAIELVPNWLDLARFHPAGPARRQAAREKLGLPARGFVAVLIANLFPVKSLQTFATAAAQVARVLQESHFVLVGEGPERPALAAFIAEQGLGRRIHLAGARENTEDYLAAADAGVLTSSSEGCSNAVLEYLSAGLPTALSDIPANRALTDEELFPVGDAAALAAMLLELASDPELRKRRGRANRLRAESYGGGAFRERVQAHYCRATAASAGREFHARAPRLATPMVRHG